MAVDETVPHPIYYVIGQQPNVREVMATVIVIGPPKLVDRVGPGHVAGLVPFTVLLRGIGHGPLEFLPRE